MSAQRLSAVNQAVQLDSKESMFTGPGSSCKDVTVAMTTLYDLPIEVFFRLYLACLS